MTGQAFEDVQDQNKRLLKTLTEKEEANLNQLSEWTKTSHSVRAIKEEKGVLEEQIRLMQAKIEALNRSIHKHQERVSKGAAAPTTFSACAEFIQFIFKIPDVSCWD